MALCQSVTNFNVAQLQDDAVGEYLSNTYDGAGGDVELKRQIISGLCKTERIDWLQRV